MGAFPHDADAGVHGFGKTAAEAFEEAARALTAVITHAKVEPRVRVDLSCEATDIELLFVEMAQRRHLRDGSA